MTKVSKGPAAIPLPPPRPSTPMGPLKSKKGSAGWGHIATPSAAPAPVPPVAKVTDAAPTVEAATAAQAAGAPRKRMARARTMKDIIKKHLRPDGKRGFTYRDLCLPLHVSTESLRAAIINPGRFSISSVIALAGLMGEDPLVLCADIIAEVKANPKAKEAKGRQLRVVVPGPPKD